MRILVFAALLAFGGMTVLPMSARGEDRPNILFILTDDQRWDHLGASELAEIETPHLDRICSTGTRFENAFVTLAICSPSRAACLTGRYGSVNGVTAVGSAALDEDERTFAHILGEAGYRTGVTGKWHLKTSPEQCGFDFASTCWSNGTWYDRKFTIDGQAQVRPGFVDDVVADESIRFIRQAVDDPKPFALWVCTQVPHMDHRFTWPARESYLSRYSADRMPVPTSWSDDLEGKPEYLRAARNRTQALSYGYDRPERIREHARDYAAGVTQMDAAVGRILEELDRLHLSDQTWILVMGDNGWMLGEHGMTSKVLPYEESIRVPMAIAGPATEPRVAEELVLNIDLTATILDLAGLEVEPSVHGRSLLPLVQGRSPGDWRTSLLYEAPTPQLGSRPLWAVRDQRWKYVETQIRDGQRFRELYDLTADPIEMVNLVDRPEHRQTERRLAIALDEHRRAIAEGPGRSAREVLPPPVEPTPSTVRTDLVISGIRPHLTTYGISSQGGAHRKSGHDECGIGAIVPWAGKLWMVNYAPHMPRGSEHKLYSVDPDLSQPLTIHPESVGGTPAGRMIHEESNQLLIGHYLIDAQGQVRAISPRRMPIRITAIARHLTDPANRVYYIDMEGAIWEADVHTLEVQRLFEKPVPGWHGKGGYTSQGRLVIANNGEKPVGKYRDLRVGGKPESEQDRGVLAEFDGTDWKIVERRQFTDVTGPRGITGGSDGDDPIWAIGWDRRSLRLKLLESGTWHTYLLPKASFCNDPGHGWYTEWPRIREITEGRWMMDMHGMFFQFPKTFSSTNSAGLTPIGSHLRYIPDFCGWNEHLVLASDETSIQGNPLAGQPQSNLWFGSFADLQEWGPANGYGGPWVEDRVEANSPSDPFLIAGFARRVLHLAVGRKRSAGLPRFRTADQIAIRQLPEKLEPMTRVTIRRGDWHRPAPGFGFQVDRPVTVYLAVDRRGDPQLPSAWRKTDLSLAWSRGPEAIERDDIYVARFEAGAITIPGNTSEHTPGSFGMPHLAFVESQDPTSVQVRALPQTQVVPPDRTTRSDSDLEREPVGFTIQIDPLGRGDWQTWETVSVPAEGYLPLILPDDLKAVWLRVVTDRDCTATAYLHQTTDRFHDGQAPANQRLFAGLADIDEAAGWGGRIYPAKRNRNLRVITPDRRGFDFTKSLFEFVNDQWDPQLHALLEVEPEFTVDAASVVLSSGERTYRLPKGSSSFDQPLASGWPRMSREVESERHLANIHGTFYEVPLVTNGAPPNWRRMRPVSSHTKQISDYASWNGLLVLAGVRAEADPKDDVHLFADADREVGLWLGGVDDLWKLGKPIGHGGPWRDTPVRAGLPSDPYLMTGYDRKSVAMSHRSPEPVTITLQVDIDGTGLWVDYRRFVIQPGELATHTFPEGFSACWIRAISDRETKATVQLTYE